MGTWCLGNLLMLRATRTSRRAARAWFPPLACFLTIRYECRSRRARASGWGTRRPSCIIHWQVSNKKLWAT